MSCPRARTLLNPGESQFLGELCALVEPHQAEVACKVGLKDAVDLNHSGLSDDHYSYALCAHLDFVVVDRATSRIMFGVLAGRQRPTGPASARAKVAPPEVGSAAPEVSSVRGTRRDWHGSLPRDLRPGHGGHRSKAGERPCPCMRNT